jgi:hypothetical protein
MQFKVIVTEKGDVYEGESANRVVYDGKSHSEANRIFSIFVHRCTTVLDSSKHETVTLFKNYDVIRQWFQRPER